MIHIRFFANMRTIIGQENLDIPHFNAKTLRDLLVRLVEMFPNLQNNLLDEHGNLYKDVPIFINGRNPRLSKTGINLSLEPGDVISLFSPISSGRINVEVMRKPDINNRKKSDES